MNGGGCLQRLCWSVSFECGISTSFTRPNPSLPDLNPYRIVCALHKRCTAISIDYLGQVDIWSGLQRGCRQRGNKLAALNRYHPASFVIKEYKILIKLRGPEGRLKNLACTIKINNFQVVVVVKNDAGLLQESLQIF